MPVVPECAGRVGGPAPAGRDGEREPFLGRRAADGEGDAEPALLIALGGVEHGDTATCVDAHGSARGPEPAGHFESGARLAPAVTPRAGLGERLDGEAAQAGGRAQFDAEPLQVHGGAAAVHRLVSGTGREPGPRCFGTQREPVREPAGRLEEPEPQVQTA